mmetsp:Transcript_1062/g.1759  ORF Transcript_1062/g.1759 Transcript_1062/m.1759 type:complete len:87 (-) Transcript_1062:1631-1891(-)
MVNFLMDLRRKFIMALLRSNDPVPMGLLDRSGVASPASTILFCCCCCIAVYSDLLFYYMMCQRAISYSQSKHTPSAYSISAVPKQQ